MCREYNYKIVGKWALYHPKIHSKVPGSVHRSPVKSTCLHLKKCFHLRWVPHCVWIIWRWTRNTTANNLKFFNDIYLLLIYRLIISFSEKRDAFVPRSVLDASLLIVKLTRTSPIYYEKNIRISWKSTGIPVYDQDGQMISDVRKIQSIDWV